MTTIQAGNQARAGSAAPDARLLGLFTPAGAVMALLVTAALAALYWPWLRAQHEISSTQPADWGHAYVVPIISAYLLWLRKDELARAPVATFWPGLIPMVLGVTCYFFFVVGVPNGMGQGWSLVLTIFGVCLLLLGPRAIEPLFFPIAYLVFAVTIAEMIMIKLTFRLQQVAAEGAYVMLNVLGITTDLRGNTLTVVGGDGSTHELGIAEACSGMRMLVAFVALGTAVALVACRHWWQRVALVILAAPVAVLVNLFRVVSLGIASLFNQDLAEGEAHMFIGTLWLIPGFLLYMLIVWALNRCVSEPEPLARTKGGSR